jgi:hypothetical protein
MTQFARSFTAAVHVCEPLLWLDYASVGLITRSASDVMLAIEQLDAVGYSQPTRMLRVRPGFRRMHTAMEIVTPSWSVADAGSKGRSTACEGHEAICGYVIFIADVGTPAF